MPTVPSKRRIDATTKQVKNKQQLRSTLSSDDRGPANDGGRGGMDAVTHVSLALTTTRGHENNMLASPVVSSAARATPRAAAATSLASSSSSGHVNFDAGAAALVGKKNSHITSKEPRVDAASVLLLPPPSFLRATTTLGSLASLSEAAFLVPPLQCTTSMAGQQLLAERLIETPCWEDRGSDISGSGSGSSGESFGGSYRHQHHSITGPSTVHAALLAAVTAESGFAASPTLPQCKPGRFLQEHADLGTMSPSDTNRDDSASGDRGRSSAPTAPARVPRVHQHVALAQRNSRLYTSVPTSHKPCKCKTSRCLKLYCTCFQGGYLCGASSCRCQNCHNTAEHNAPGGVRHQVIDSILLRRADAFEPKIKANDNCSCKTCNCLRKYCECYRGGYYCSPACQCFECQNMQAPGVSDVGDKNVASTQDATSAALKPSGMAAYMAGSALR